MRVALFTLVATTVFTSACAKRVEAEDTTQPTPTQPRTDTPAASGNGALSANSQAAMMQAAMAVQAAQMAAKLKCDPLLTRAISREEEIAIGKPWGEAVVRRLGKPLEGADSVKSWVQQVGANVAKASNRGDLPWTFTVVDSDQKAIVGAPGGGVFVTTARLKDFTNEAQLAGALAHEVAHVASPDALASYRRVTRTQCELAVTAEAMAKVMPQQGGAEVARFAEEFSQKNLMAGQPDFQAFLGKVVMEVDAFANPDAATEFEADATAARLAASAGYDVGEYTKFLATAEDVSHHHPPAAERTAKLDALRAAEPKVFQKAKTKTPVGKKLEGLNKP